MPLQSRPAFRVSLVAIVLFQVSALFARSMLDVRLQRNGMDAAVASDLSYLVVPPILLVLMLPYLRRCRDSILQLFDRRLLTLRVVACSIALGLTLRLMWWASTTFLIGIGVFRDENPETIVGPTIGFQCPPIPILLLSFLVMSFLVPVIEEVVHRGYILHALLIRNTGFAIVVSALLFAFMHSAPYVTPLVVGLFLAVQALNYRALWGPVITHATFNGAAILDWDCFRIVWNPTVEDPVLAKLTGVSLLGITATILLSLFLAGGRWSGRRYAPTHRLLSRGRWPRAR